MSEECRVLTKEQYDEMFRRINELEQNLAGAEQSVQEGLEINEELKADNKQLYDKCKLEHSIVKDLQKENKELSIKVLQLEKKLDIAIYYLKKYANVNSWQDCRLYDGDDEEYVKDACYEKQGYEDAQEALKQINCWIDKYENALNQIKEIK